jgi:hypothetical protein
MSAVGNLEVGAFGSWRIIARAPGHPPVDISWVRDVPTTVGDWSEADPFGPVSAELTFPAVTIFDHLGSGELFWLTKHVDFDIVWDGELPAGYPYAGYAWEGFSESFQYSSGGVKVTLKGGMYQLDNYLGKPEYPPRPLPYEYAIARQWDERPDLRLGRMQIVWPAWWDTTYQPDAKTPSYLQPAGVGRGDKWTGLLTRRTGSWDQVLTSYIQTMLTGMYTERGRWSLEMRPGRQVFMVHRDFKHEADAQTIVIDAINPGVKIDLSEDWSQSLNVVYGQGTSLQGTGYSGMQVTNDGQATVYRPLAALRQVEPVTDANGWLESSRMRKEVQLQLTQGLEEAEARKVGQAHLMHFADPGLTGTITLSADVRLGGPDGDIMPRSLIVPGMTVQLRGVFGSEFGVMLHVVSGVKSPSTGTVTLTVDSKYRDALTVDEVRVRGRDALNVTRQLIGGLYEPPIPDALVPWNYAEGSGYIPSSEKLSSQRLFEGMPNDIEFPYEEWTTNRPPRSPSFKDCYIRIGPADTVHADNNWAKNPSRDASAGAGSGYGFPIKMAQQGSIRLLQIAAYDGDGNVMAVPFHFSLYYSNGVNVQSMPRIPAEQSGLFGPVKPPGYVVNADSLQHYPFHNNAWERFNANGTQRGTDVVVSVETAGLVRGWGTGSAKAGYWPGSSAAGDLPTGLLVDEGVFEFNPYTDPAAVNAINPYSTIQKAPAAGFLYGMIYCDAQGEEPVYFAGRMFRVEPGTSV